MLRSEIQDKKTKEYLGYRVTNAKQWMERVNAIKFTQQENVEISAVVIDE